MCYFLTWFTVLKKVTWPLTVHITLQLSPINCCDSTIESHKTLPSHQWYNFNVQYRSTTTNMGMEVWEKEAWWVHWKYQVHDDVIKWKHFPRHWPFVREIHRFPVNSPHKGQWRGALMFSLICVWIRGWVNSREAGDLRRYLAHYDVIVMGTIPTVSSLVISYVVITTTLGFTCIIVRTCK